MTETDAAGHETARRRLMLLAWFSPAFPIGGFAFSHGLEWAQEAGAVEGRAALEGWIGDLLAHGSGRADGLLLAAAHRAATAGEPAALDDLIALGAALQPSAERYLEATVQGAAFLTMIRAAYPHPGLDSLLPPDAGGLTLPVAAGLAGAVHGLAADDLLAAYLSGFAAALVSAAVRLGIVGQTDGQRVTAALQPVIAALVPGLLALGLEDLGTGTLRSDLFSLQHETQYSRLFRS